MSLYNSLLETARWRHLTREQRGKEEGKGDKRIECKEGGKAKKKVIGKILYKEESNTVASCYMTTGMGSSVHELRIFRMKQKSQKSLTKKSIDCYPAHI